MITTAQTITRPKVTKTLLEAGFIKAEWKSRAKETLWNDGFILAEAFSWTGDRILDLEYHVANWNRYNKQEVSQILMNMSEILTSAGLEHKLIDVCDDRSGYIRFDLPTKAGASNV
jgi:hypothetical protein